MSEGLTTGSSYHDKWSLRIWMWDTPITFHYQNMLPGIRPVLTLMESYVHRDQSPINDHNPKCPQAHSFWKTIPWYFVSPYKVSKSKYSYIHENSTPDQRIKLGHLKGITGLLTYHTCWNEVFGLGQKLDIWLLSGILFLQPLFVKLPYTISPRIIAKHPDIRYLAERKTLFQQTCQCVNNR